MTEQAAVHATEDFRPRYSFFDVFDTLIVRSWAQPHDVFRQTGTILNGSGIISITPDAYTVLRIEAERSARRNSAREDVTLTDIYRQMQQRLSWSEARMDLAMNLELELECASHRLNPEMAAMLSQHRAHGWGIAFISDMYLPAQAIEASLRRLGLWVEGDALFVSGEIGLTKRSGELFRYALTKLAIGAEETTHIGDNALGDHRVPALLGIHATLYRTGALSQYERAVDATRGLDQDICGKIAGAMRLARLSCNPNATPADRTIWNTSANIIGPVLFAFVAWCLQRARERGMGHLYFLARDGQILLRIVEALGSKWRGDVQCTYLYASRQAWLPCAMDADSPESLEWALAMESGAITLETIARRLGLTAEQLAPRAERLSDAARLPLSSNDVDLIRRLLATPKLAGTIKRRATQARARLLDYLRQEGMLERKSWAMVDIGWKGRLQHSLSAVLRSVNESPANGTQGFYFGLTREPSLQPSDGVETFYFAPKPLRGHRRQLCTPAVLEQFTEADHGTTIGYSSDGECITPVLSERTNAKALQWGLRTQHEGIVAFAREIGAALSPEQVAEAIGSGAWQNLCDTLLSAFSYRPSEDEAHVYGAFAKNSELEHQDHHELAPRLSVLESMQLIATGPQRLARKGKPVMWAGGSFARSGHRWAGDMYQLRHRIARAFDQRSNDENDRP